MKRKWLGILVFISLIGGFASCYRPFGYGHYSDGYGYRHGRSYYSHRGHQRRDRGRAYYRSYTSHSRSARRTSDRDRTRW